MNLNGDHVLTPSAAPSINFLMNKMDLQLTTTESHRFWSKVDITTSDLCWEWIGYRLPFGHGQVGIRRKVYLTHRVAYAIMKSPIPAGKHFRHLCDNPSCCNPNHLALGTDLDNSNDKCRQGRQARGTGNGRSKLTEQQVLHIYNSNQTQEDLAVQFGIHQPMVSRIKNGVYWSWLTGATR